MSEMVTSFNGFGILKLPLHLFSVFSEVKCFQHIKRYFGIHPGLNPKSIRWFSLKGGKKEMFGKFKQCFA